MKRGREMKYKDIELVWLGHSGFKLKSKEGIICYIDPFKIFENEERADKADFILITHSHYDHCSVEDIKKIVKEGTIIVCTPDCLSKFRHIDYKVEIKTVMPGDRLEFKEGEVKIWAVMAYNTNKNFHTREEDWVGFIIQLEDVSVYHAGDTDLIQEMKQIKATGIDIALLPIGGTYTMNAGEAAKAASLIKPGLAIPMHYASIEGIGGKNEADLFLKYCSIEGVDVRILEVEKT